MRQVVVLSGKGGTGKTSVTAALAHLASLDRRVVTVDADVDASNLGLVLGPRERERTEFMGGQAAHVDPDACERCGECLEACRFGAVRAPGEIDEAACEGCAACAHRCPAGAIAMRPVATGERFVSDTRFGPLHHARLRPGRDNSGKLVTAVRRAATTDAERCGHDLVLVDGPPGVGCPVIAAATGCGLALLVTEPTVSGAEDLLRALATVRHFDIPALVIVNKADLSPRWTNRIVDRCRAEGVEVVAKIPFDPEVTRAMVRGEAVTEAGRGEASVALRSVVDRV